MGSKAKDAAAKLHEKHQTILADLLRDEENRFCADCKAKGKNLYQIMYIIYSIICSKGNLSLYSIVGLLHMLCM